MIMTVEEKYNAALKKAREMYVEPSKVITGSVTYCFNKRLEKIFGEEELQNTRKVYYENSDSCSIIKDWLSWHGGKEYVEWVAEQLNCSVCDLVYVEVHPDFVEEDEEGCNIESFFAKGTEIKTILIHSDMENRNCKINELVFKDFSIGDVCRVEADGKTFYADYNASPIGVITKKRELW